MILIWQDYDRGTCLKRCPGEFLALLTDFTLDLKGVIFHLGHGSL